MTYVETHAIFKMGLVGRVSKSEAVYGVPSEKW